MKRSKINTCIQEMERLLAKNGFRLPMFSRWTAADWSKVSREYDEIRDNQLGWDITDCGLGDWDRIGFALFTIRNGNQKNKKYKKTYAEKVIMLQDGQRFPLHYHVNKSEDIINRGGGTLLITVYNADRNGKRLSTDVTVNADGRSYRVPAGTAVEIEPGNSITLWPYQYHSFAVVAGSGAVLIGEVSQCNDDESDNYFFEDVGRFPTIEEDEAAYRLLCTEYPTAQS